MDLKIKMISIFLAVLCLSLNSKAQSSLTSSFSSETSPDGESAVGAEINFSHDFESGNTFFLDLGYEQGVAHSGYTDTAVAYTYNFGDLTDKGLAIGGGLVLPTGNYKQGLGGGALGIQARNLLAYGITINSHVVVDIAYTMFVNYNSPEGIKYDHYEFNINHKYTYLLNKRIAYTLTSETNWTDTLEVTDPADPSTAKVKTEVNWTLGTGVEFECKKKNDVSTIVGFEFITGVAPSMGLHGASFFINWQF